MFAKNREAEEPKSAKPVKAAKVSKTDIQTPKPKNGTPALLSKDVAIEGDMSSSGDVQIDGRMNGNLKAGSITVGREAILEGDVEAESIVVHGRLIGNIKARDVRIRHTAHVEGNITQEALVIEPGAFFDGTCRQSSDPLNEFVPTAKHVEAGQVASGLPLGGQAAFAK